MRSSPARPQNLPDLDDAIEIARQLSQTLDMPQQADALTIFDAKGLVLHSGAVHAEAAMKEGYNNEHS
jgi:peptidase E